MLDRTAILTAVALLAMSGSASSSRIVAQMRADSIGPAVAWQIQPSGEAGLITGIIFTSAGQPLRGARIRVSGLDRLVETNASGQFSLKPQLTGKLDVRIEALGYHVARDTVFMPPGRSVFMTGVLREAVIHITTIRITPIVRPDTVTIQAR